MRFRFTGSGRPYDDLGIVAVPGEEYDLAKDPGDGLWEALEQPPAKADTKQAAPAADAKEK